MLNSVFMNLLGRESLIAADNTWGLLGVMCLAVAFSIFLEQKYKWASKISGAIIALILGKTKQEALELADRFLRMIRGEATEAEKESLDEAAILEDVSHMPARVKCATLGWHTIQEMLKDKEA